MTPLFNLARSASCLFTFFVFTHFSFTNLLLGVIAAIVGVEALVVVIVSILFRDTDRDRETQWRGKDL